MTLMTIFLLVGFLSQKHLTPIRVTDHNMEKELIIYKILLRLLAVIVISLQIVFALQNVINNSF